MSRARRVALPAALAVVVSATIAQPASARFVPRIIGGGSPVATIATYPFQVALYSAAAPSPNSGQFCGGVIIDATHVATAAHCVVDQTTGQVTPPSSIKVLAGTTHLRSAGQASYSSGFYGSNVRQISVLATSFDPRYDPSTNDYDAAVLKLPSGTPLYTGSPVPDGLSDIAPIPLISSSDVTTYADPDGTNGPVTVSGWGDISPEPINGNPDPVYPQDLQAVTTHLVSTVQCNGAYAPPILSPRLICAGDVNQDACFGDSGGPLTVQAAASPGAKPNNDELVGFVDSGLGCGQPGFPGVYSRAANPDIAGFVSADHVQAPQQSSNTTITGTGEPGQTLTCNPGAWSDNPTFKYQFGTDPGDGTGGVALTPSSPQNTYAVRDSDVGTQVFCEVKASNLGGYGFADSADLGISTRSSTEPPPTITAKDTVRPLLRVKNKSCVHRRCTVNVQVADPAPSSGIRKVQTTLTHAAKVPCRRNGRRTTCVRTRTAHPAAKSIGGGHFLIKTARLRLRTTYRLTLVAFDKAGNRQRKATRLTLRVNRG